MPFTPKLPNPPVRVPMRAIEAALRFIERAAKDRVMTDEVYDAIYEFKNALAKRND